MLTKWRRAMVAIGVALLLVVAALVASGALAAPTYPVPFESTSAIGPQTTDFTVNVEVCIRYQPGWTVTAQADAGATSVVVTVRSNIPLESPCTDLLVEASPAVHLDAPLGARSVLDGWTSPPTQVYP